MYKTWHTVHLSSLIDTVKTCYFLCSRRSVCKRQNMFSPFPAVRVVTVLHWDKPLFSSVHPLPPAVLLLTSCQSAACDNSAALSCLHISSIERIHKSPSHHCDSSLIICPSATFSVSVWMLKDFEHNKSWNAYVGVTSNKNYELFPTETLVIEFFFISYKIAQWQQKTATQQHRVFQNFTHFCNVPHFCITLRNLLHNTPAVQYNHCVLPDLQLLKWFSIIVRVVRLVSLWSSEQSCSCEPAVQVFEIFTFTFKVVCCIIGTRHKYLVTEMKTFRNACSTTCLFCRSMIRKMFFTLPDSIFHRHWEQAICWLKQIWRQKIA